MMCKFASRICTFLAFRGPCLFLSFFHFLLLANVEVVERGADELQGLVQGVRVQATGVQNVHSEAYVSAEEKIIGPLRHGHLSLPHLDSSRESSVLTARLNLR